ncbi:MAG: hypothetical protein Q4C44_01785 [bacterium]|nr:hypothetical protein [bacterium]
MLLAGVSYAVFNSYASQNSTNTLAATCIELEFSGEDSVNLINVYPISDSEGLKTTPYKFKIKNKCKNYLEYMVIASAINITNPLDSKYVKVNLSGDNEMEPVSLSSLKSIQTPSSLSGYSIKENYVLKDNDGILKDEERNFEFRMWLDGENEETWTSEQVESKNYQVKISVIGTVKIEPKSDIYIAALIDGEESLTFPTTADYMAKVNCTRGGKKVDTNASIKWTGARWALTTTITDGNTRCNVSFVAEPAPDGWYAAEDGTLLAAIKSDNELEPTITTPGTATSYSLADKIPDWIFNVDAYYTYGDTYKVNSDGTYTIENPKKIKYSDELSILKGKYMVSSQDNYSDAFSSNDELLDTTNKKQLLLIRDTASDGFTYSKISGGMKTFPKETEAVMATTADDYGTSYYFRGAVENNYIEFANKCWRIVRVTGNGSIKLALFNNNANSSTNPCAEVNDSKEAATVGSSMFNYAHGDNAFVGFMYGNAGCSNGTSINKNECTSAGGTWNASTSYANAQANVNKSTILKYLEEWYNNNLASYDSYIADTIWCNDKSTVKDTSFNPWGWTLGTNYGYGFNSNYYSANKRLLQNDEYGLMLAGNPSLICPNDNNGGKLSKFTVSDTTNGNGNLDKKIGLLTADEVVFAGGGEVNYSFYLIKNTYTWWWTMSPGDLGNVGTSMWGVSGDHSIVGIYLTIRSRAVRPSISLVSTVRVTSGNGTRNNPYKITV